MFVIKLAQDPYFISRNYKSEASAQKDLAQMKKMWAMQGYFKTSMGERIPMDELNFSINPK